MDSMSREWILSVDLSPSYLVNLDQITQEKSNKNVKTNDTRIEVKDSKTLAESDLITSLNLR